MPLFQLGSRHRLQKAEGAAWIDRQQERSMEDNTKQTSEAISDDVRLALEILSVPMAVYAYEGGQLDGASSAARRIVKGILDCAADLGIDTLAEGVETRE